MRVENLVLLVEDDTSLRRSLEKFLNHAGYTFESCSTAAQALALAEKVPPHVVILEYHLPDANGPSLIEKLSSLLLLLRLLFPNMISKRLLMIWTG